MSSRRSPQSAKNRPAKNRPAKNRPAQKRPQAGILKFAMLCLALLVTPSVSGDGDKAALSEGDLKALRELSRFAEAELLKGTEYADKTARANAVENRKHILRMIEDIRGHNGSLKRAGVNVEVAAVGILFSDLGKNATYLEAHAKRVFPQLYQENPGAAKFKAFLLHEEPGIRKLQELAPKYGLSEKATQRVVQAIVGHNGPSIEGSWWKTQWDAQIKNHKGPANSEMVGKSYPKAMSVEGAVHTIFDRIDQGSLNRGQSGWEGGPKKIHNDIKGSMDFKAAIVEAIGGNPEKTLVQLEALKKTHPKLFELEVVRQGVERVETTRSLLNHVEFIETKKGGEKVVESARIHSVGPDGKIRTVVVSSGQEFWRELGKIQEPIRGAKAWTAEGRTLLRESIRPPAQLPPAELRAIETQTKELLKEAKTRLSPREYRAFERSVKFARAAHSTALRDGGEPAIRHSLRVSSQVLKTPGASVQAAMAAVLHDVVEDTRFKRSDISKRFGEKVAGLVEAVTLDPLNRFGGRKDLRDKAYYERFKTASRDAHIIKFQDRLDNIRDMRGWPPEGRLGYLEATRAKIIESLKGKSPDLARQLESEVKRVERAIRSAQVQDYKMLEPYRRADGTLNWKRLSGDKVLQAGKGTAHFALALFLKELAVVMTTGDRVRIEEFFDGLMTTDFFVTYGLFSMGAYFGNVLYSNTLERVIKPRFVGGLLKTNVILATGMALPELYHGTFNGKAFAIDVVSLGLSSFLVKAGLQQISWVVNLARNRGSGRLLQSAAALKKYARLGGWFYTAAETAVVLYFGEDISRRINNYLDKRAARDVIEEATEDFFKAVNNPNISPEAFNEALSDFEATHAEYRNSLYKPLFEAQGLYTQRLNTLSIKAKNLADKRRELLKKLDRFPRLKAVVLRQHKSVEAYEAHLTAKDEKELDQSFNNITRAFERSRQQLLRDVYQSNRRSDAYLGNVSLYSAKGAKRGGAGDPLSGRSDFFSRKTRDFIRSRLGESARNISDNRLQAYDDLNAALALAERAAAGQEDKLQLLREAGERTRTLKSRDRQLVSVRSQGAAGALRGQ